MATRAKNRTFNTSDSDPLVQIQGPVSSKLINNLMNAYPFNVYAMYTYVYLVSNMSETGSYFPLVSLSDYMRGTNWYLQTSNNNTMLWAITYV